MRFLNFIVVSIAICAFFIPYSEVLGEDSTKEYHSIYGYELEYPSNYYYYDDAMGFQDTKWIYTSIFSPSPVTSWADVVYLDNYFLVSHTDASRWPNVDSQDFKHWYTTYVKELCDRNQNDQDYIWKCSNLTIHQIDYFEPQFFGSYSFTKTKNTGETVNIDVNDMFIIDGGQLFNLHSSRDQNDVLYLAPMNTFRYVGESGGGGCLIATAAYGSELSPQVQYLREIRDNKVMSTSSGTSFMTGFNQFYYSFSPYVADYERENPVFKEMVKIGITPMLSSLSIMSLADSGSEEQVLGYGIAVIVLNGLMYFVAPMIVLIKLAGRENKWKRS